jgi:hypothetical protein
VQASQVIARNRVQDAAAEEGGTDQDVDDVKHRIASWLVLA